MVGHPGLDRYLDFSMRMYVLPYLFEYSMGIESDYHMRLIFRAVLTDFFTLPSLFAGDSLIQVQTPSHRPLGVSTSLSSAFIKCSF